jgi:hypothetical protein
MAAAAQTCVKAEMDEIGEVGSPSLRIFLSWAVLTIMCERPERGGCRTDQFLQLMSEPPCLVGQFPQTGLDLVFWRDGHCHLCILPVRKPSEKRRSGPPAAVCMPTVREAAG